MWGHIYHFISFIRKLDLQAKCFRREEEGFGNVLSEKHFQLQIDSHYAHKNDAVWLQPN